MCNLPHKFSHNVHHGSRAAGQLMAYGFSMTNADAAQGPEFFEREEDHEVDLTSPVFLDDLTDEDPEEA